MSKALIFAALLLITLFPFESFATEVAITMDDPGMESVAEYTPAEINHRILATLRKNGIQAALFVCGKRVDSAAGKVLIEEWDQEGHWIGSHSYSHLYYHDDAITPAKYIEDINKNLPIISGYKNFKRFFRFPFLKEGDTVEKRDTIRQYLAKNQFKNGYVTIDTSDWAISTRLKSAIIKGRKDLDLYRRYYIAHMIDRLKVYDRLATKTFGRQVKHTILVHHNVLNALFLGELIQALKKEGVRFISAVEAYSDPVYGEKPDLLPAGESLIWMLAKKKNPELVDQRYPAEDGVYIDPEMDRLGL